jgi:sulfur relay (sulfurtransferase) DsrF/TusC family protein
MKHLNIVSSAYRATIEEQDDTVVWISHAMRNAGAEIDLLLSGAAVNYSVRGQSVEPLNLGGRAQKHAPDVHAQVREFCGNGSKVYAVQEDLDERSIDHRSLLQEVELIGRKDLPGLLSGYDQVWHW